MSAAAGAPPLLTVADVALELRLRPAAVRGMAARGLFPGYHRLNGKELRFTRADVDGLLAKTRMAPALSPRRGRPLGSKKVPAA